MPEGIQRTWALSLAGHHCKPAGDQPIIIDHARFAFHTIFWSIGKFAQYADAGG